MKKQIIAILKDKDGVETELRIEYYVPMITHKGTTFYFIEWIKRGKVALYKPLIRK